MRAAGPLVDATWLAEHLDQVIVVDCRFDLRDPQAPRQAYRQGHIPGAVRLDLEGDLSGPTGPAPNRRGRHPLPTVAAFVASARAVGIGNGSFVVAYDEGMSGGAARLWWLLRHVGHDSAAVLEGGLAAWSGGLETGPGPASAPGDLVARERAGDLADHRDLLAAAGGLVIDVRAPERYRGEAEPIDAVAGHVPGALNVPLPELARSAPELAAHAGAHVAYCGSGVAACVAILRLAAAGRDDARLYVGSWSDWIARDLPVARGDR